MPPNLTSSRNAYNHDAAHTSPTGPRLGGAQTVTAALAESHGSVQDIAALTLALVSAPPTARTALNRLYPRLLGVALGSLGDQSGYRAISSRNTGVLSGACRDPVSGRAGR